MSRKNPTFVPRKHLIKEFEPYGIVDVQSEGRWVTINTGSAYDSNNNLVARGVRIKLKAF